MSDKQGLTSGLHQYLCSRDFNQNFSDTIDEINTNLEKDTVEEKENPSS